MEKSKTVKKMILITTSFILFILLTLFTVVGLNSPGKLNALTDSSDKVIPGSLATREWLEIGGIRQGCFIRTENTDNPVILFLHGGPGSPELLFIEAFEKGERLEKHFTVCYWDQRGAGMTYNKHTDPASLTVSQFVEDTREVTEYLQKRFGKRKIYLMGHSWGSYLGVKVAEKYPELYHAYIGMGQVTRQRLSEQLAYHYMMNKAKETNDKKTIESLSKFNPEAADFPTNKYLLSTRSLILNKYGVGMTHEPFQMTTILKSLMLFNGYTLREKANYFKGSLLSVKNVFDDVLADDLFQSSISFQIPIYIIHGRYDYQVSYELAKKWFDSIEAPDKALFTFENSAHAPNLEEQEKFVEVVKKIAVKHHPNISSAHCLHVITFSN